MKPKTIRPVSLGAAVGLLAGEACLAVANGVIVLILGQPALAVVAFVTAALLAVVGALVWRGLRWGWWGAVAMQSILVALGLKQLNLGVLFPIAGLLLLLLPATRSFVFRAPGAAAGGNMLDQ